MDKFIEFLKTSKSMYHACNNIKEKLISAGFKELTESEKFETGPNKGYFVLRDDSSIIAFKTPEDLDDLSFNITLGHLDSPSFKIKPNGDLSKISYSMLNTEVYGGPILNTWFDRPLDISGRVVINDKNKIYSKLLSFDKGMCVIPNLCIHFNREGDNKLNPQKDTIPLLSIDSDIKLNKLIVEKLNISENSIMGTDLYLSTLERGAYTCNGELFTGPQIDNLECSYIEIEELINSKPHNDTINVVGLFNNEEIGSLTLNGADSTFLSEILRRITLSVGLDEEDHLITLSKSFIVSVDNAHALHPNYTEKYDPTNSPRLNEGVVIKSAARGSYTTNAMSEGVFKKICELAGTKCQMMANRSDIRGGSTLGAITLSHVSVLSVDIGLAQLAMHSAYETCGVKDYTYMSKAINKFFTLDIKNNGKYIEVNE